MQYSPFDGIETHAESDLGLSIELKEGAPLKSKPLIKTHWLASQNPLTVPLQGLQSVVLSPSPEILAAHFSAPTPAPVALAPLASVQDFRLTEEIHSSSRHQRLGPGKDPVWLLFSGQDQFQVSKKLQALVRCLEFHFEDGSVHSLIGIFHKSGWPRFLDPKFYFQDPSCNWEKGLKSVEDLMRPLKIFKAVKRQEDHRKLWLMILEMLAWSFQRQRQVGDLRVLWCPPTPDPHASRQAFVLEDLEILKELPLAATVSVLPGGGSSAQIRLWQGESVASSDEVLRLHGEEILQELETYFLGSAPSVVFPESSSPDPDEQRVLASASDRQLRWRSCFSTAESGSRELLRSLHHLEKIIGRSHVHFVRHLSVQGSDFKPVLKIRESEGSWLMGVLFEVPSLGLRHFNFPESMRAVFSFFAGGLEQILGVDRKDLASKQKKFRSQDLLFLRHQGLILFSLFEMINWVLRRPLSSGEEIEFIDNLDSPQADQQFGKVVSYLQSSLPALLGKPSLSFEELLSPKVQEIYLNFLEKLFHALVQDRSLFFQGDRLLELRAVYPQVLPLLRFLILSLIEASQGKFLLRAQAPLGERFLSQLPFWSEPQILSQDNPLWSSYQPRWMDIGRMDESAIALLFELQDQGLQVEFNGVSLASGILPFEFSFSVRESQQNEGGHWFDLHPEIFFNGVRVPADEVKIHFGQGQVGFVEFKGQVYRIDKKQIPSFKSLQRFWRKIKGLRQAGPRDSFGDRVYKLATSRALELLMLKQQGLAVHIENGPWKRVFDYFEKGLGVEKIQLPPETEKELLAHQREGVQWLHDLYELRLGALLADEMGLGKTFQVLSFLISLMLRDQLGRCLIVVPTSLVYNWVDEKKKFAPDLPLRVFHSGEMAELREMLATKKPLVLVATYGLLVENLEFFQMQEWNVLAFDEAQNLKNITSMRSVAARKLQAQFKICVTGTPMENNYLEFYSLCDLVVPGCLGEIDAFRRQYLNRQILAESLRELRLIAKPLLLRRTKQQVKLTLPEKTVQKVSLPFEQKQKDIYKKMAMTFSRQVEELIQAQGEKKAQIAMFSALMRLRQICSDPASVPGVDYPERPVKVDHFLNSVQEHLENQESVVVFTQFLSTLGRIRRELERLGIPVYVLQGSVSAKERIRLIAEFQNNPEPAVMLMTLKTGGVGLNLTKASIVYHLEPWWNPAVENQATDRAHRMGQKKDVKVFNLLIEGSLEERIADLKLKKQDSFDRLFAPDEGVEETEGEWTQALSREDFFYLLK